MADLTKPEIKEHKPVGDSPAKSPIDNTEASKRASEEVQQTQLDSKKAKLPDQSDTVTEPLKKDGTPILPSLELVNPQERAPGTRDISATPEQPVRRLSQETIDTNARELQAALKETTLLGLMSKPNQEKVERILGPMSRQDREALEESFAKQFGKGDSQALRRQLKESFGEVNGTRLESLLNREDGRTNDAGAVRVALAQAKEDPAKANAELAQIFRQLNSEQIATLKADYQKHYNRDLVADLKTDANISPALRNSVEILTKGSDKRTSQDVIDIAKLAVAGKDRDVLTNFIGGESPQAVEARATLMQDRNFRLALAQAFPSDTPVLTRTRAGQINPTDQAIERGTDKAVLDYLKQGHIGLDTIARQNSGGWFFNNPENISLALRNATPSERQMFTLGQNLKDSDRQPANNEERRAKEFYQTLNGALEAGGNPRQASIWNDQLTNGRPTIISEMAATHSDGFSPLAIGSGHTTNELMAKAEKLSQTDWQLLRDPATGQQFRAAIEKSLSTYATPEETARTMALLDQKAKANTYEEAAKIVRPLADTINDSRSTYLFGMATSYDTRSIVEGISKMTAESAAKYKADPEFRREVDAIVKDNLNYTERVYATSMLAQVEKSGEPPQESDRERVIGNSLRNAPAENSLRDIEKLLSDRDLRARLNKPAETLSEEDRNLKQIIENSIYKIVAEKMPLATESSYLVHQRFTEQQMKELLDNGQLSAATKLQWGFDRQNLYQQVAQSDSTQRQAAERYFSPEEKQLVKAITDQGGQSRLEDRLRAFVVSGNGNYQEFQNELRGLTNEQKQVLKDEYQNKYGSSLNEDFLKKVTLPQDQNIYRQYLTPSDSDGRQDGYDNYRRFLDSRGGVTIDGTALTAERATELYTSSLENYQREFKKLSPTQQEAMNQFFGEALKQNQNSKERLAEIITDATITAAALAAAPFTAGLSTAALATVISTAAVTGAAFRVGVFSGVQGGDFERTPENILKNAVLGGTTAALSVIGPGMLAKTGRFAEQASVAIVADLAETSVASTLRQGADQILSREIAQLASRGGLRTLSEAELNSLVSKVAKEGLDETQTAALRQAIERSSSSRIQQASEALSQDIAKSSTLGRQVINNSAIGAGANAVTEVVVAPFDANGVNWDKLAQGALTGAAVGAVMPLAFRAIARAGQEAAVIGTRISKQADGIYIDPKDITEPISFKNKRTGEIVTIKPNEGEKLKLTNDWQYENGGRSTPDVNARVPVAAERMTASELREVSNTIASRLGEHSVTSQQFREIFDGKYTINGVSRQLTVEERRIATEIMEQSMPNMTSRTIDERMVSLKNQLEATPGWNWQKRTDPQGRPYDGVNILVLDGTTDGNALSHLFHKNTGVAPTIKVLQGAELERMQMGLKQVQDLQKTIENLQVRYANDLDKVLNPREGLTVRQIIEGNKEKIEGIRKKHDLDNAIIFDDIRQANPQQREILAGMGNLAVADLNSLNRAPNIYDFSSLGFGAGSDHMRDRMSNIIERAQALQRTQGLSQRDAVRLALDDNYGQAVRDRLPNSHLLATPNSRTRQELRDSASPGNDSASDNYRIQSLYQEITAPTTSPQQIENFLGRLSADQQRLGARVLQDGLVVNNYSDMLTQARQLHQNILSTVPDRDPSKLLIITGLEENGSAYLTNSLYARANGLTSENFVSLKDLQVLAAKKPGEKLTDYQTKLLQTLGDRKLVYLDDYAYSGRQMPGLMDLLQRETLSRLRGPDGKPLVPEVTVGTLGRYDLPENTWNNATTYPNLHANGDKPFLRVNVAESPVTYQQLYDSQFFRQSLTPDDQNRLTMWLGSQSLYAHSTIRTTMILPYGGPNNNVPWIQAFIESPNGLNRPARYRTADWSEIEAGKAEFDRNRVLGDPR